jgi:hypothetical protein
VRSGPGSSGRSLIEIAVADDTAPAGIVTAAFPVGVAKVVVGELGKTTPTTTSPPDVVLGNSGGVRPT